MITKDQQKSDYLKEALRLAELRLEEQHITLTTQGKKAVLIATLCIAFIGYLLAFTGAIGETYSILGWNIPLKFTNLLIFKILPCLPLAMAMLYSIQALDLEDLGTRGATPEYTLDEYFKHDLYQLMIVLLEDYNERIYENEKILGTKNREMVKARNWLFIGIPLAIVLVAFREMLLVS